MANWESGKPKRTGWYVYAFRSLTGALATGTRVHYNAKTDTWAEPLLGVPVAYKSVPPLQESRFKEIDAQRIAREARYRG